MKCHPERSEGSLATHVPREDMDVLSPRGAKRGVSQGMSHYRSTEQGGENEARGASLTLGKTKERSLGRTE